MIPKTLKQKKHEDLVDFLTQFPQHQLDGGFSRINKLEQIRTLDRFTEIPIDDIDQAVVVFTDVLNIEEGSIKNVNMYNLMRAYLTQPVCRDEINEIVEKALKWCK
jgi:hypothetical protein